MEAFQFCHGITEIALPDDVTEIDSDTFSNCNALTSVTLPDSIVEMYYSFHGCTNVRVTYKGREYSYEKLYELYSIFSGDDS